MRNVGEAYNEIIQCIWPENRARKVGETALVCFDKVSAATERGIPCASEASGDRGFTEEGCAAYDALKVLMASTRESQIGGLGAYQKFRTTLGKVLVNRTLATRKLGEAHTLLLPFRSDAPELHYLGPDVTKHMDRATDGIMLAHTASDTTQKALEKVQAQISAETVPSMVANGKDIKGIIDMVFAAPTLTSVARACDLALAGDGSKGEGSLRHISVVAAEQILAITNQRNVFPKGSAVFAEIYNLVMVNIHIGNANHAAMNPPAPKEVTDAVHK